MAKKKEGSNVPKEKIEWFDKLIAGFKDVERKGATIPYTSLNGNMFSYINKDDGTYALRLPKEEHEKFFKKYKTFNPVSFGMVMKEYVSVPDKLFKNTKELKPYFKMSLDYAKTLKPKPTKKAPAKKKK